MQILADLEGENASIVSLLVTEICTKKFLGCAQLRAVSLNCDFCRHLVVCNVRSEKKISKRSSNYTAANGILFFGTDVM